MRLRVITLKFDTSLGGFDERPLRALESAGTIQQVRELLLVHEGCPHLVCIVALPAAEPGELAASAGAKAPVPRRRAEDPRQGLTQEDTRRFEVVRTWRALRAREQGLPPYALLTNRQVLAILAAAPKDTAALARVPGISEGWARLHGDELLEKLRVAHDPGTQMPVSET